MRKVAIGVYEWVVGFILFWVSFALFLPLSIINYLCVVFSKDKSAKGYFLNTATNVDKFANRELRTILNLTLRKESGYKFGLVDETISSVLGKNKLTNTLSIVGKCLSVILDILDKNHCIKSINKEVSWG